MTQEDITPEVVADMATIHEAGPDKWASLEWRLDHLYSIVDKGAQLIPFRMNKQQRAFIRNLWYRNIVLKARQLGYSTLMQVLQLDQAIFRHNHTGVVIADTLPNASKLFGKVELAYAHLPELLQQAYPVAKREVGTLLAIEHKDEQGKPANSTISVSVSSRGGTPQLLHISELGKISLKFPQRAEEIKTGALPSVPVDGCIVIESTAEGAFGLLWELCEPAIKRWHAKAPETRLDWRLHFSPWFEAEEYRLPLEDVPHVEVSPAMHAYFHKLEVELGITIDRQQRAWYCKTKETLKRKMKQEFCSTPEEAFEQAIEGAVYGEEMTWLREQGRLGVVPLDRNYPVNTYWDFGTADATAIWFHQYILGAHRWFYYVEGTGKGLRHWWIDVLEAHRHKYGYQWGQHFLPHDADADIQGQVVETPHQILTNLGMPNIVVVPRVLHLSTGIEVTRKALGGNHWFDKHIPDSEQGEDMGAGLGIKCLDGYQFAWNEKQGVWSNEPLHNWASHGCDAFRQHAQGWGNQGLAHTDPSLGRFKNRRRIGV